MACIPWSIFNQRIQETPLGGVTAIFPGTSLSGFSESPGYPGIRYLCVQWKLGLNSSESIPASYAEGQISLGHLICHNLSPRNTCKFFISCFKLWCGQAHHLKSFGVSTLSACKPGAQLWEQKAQQHFHEVLYNKQQVQESTQTFLTSVTWPLEAIFFWTLWIFLKLKESAGSGNRRPYPPSLCCVCLCQFPRILFSKRLLQLCCAALMLWLAGVSAVCWGVTELPVWRHLFFSLSMIQARCLIHE